MKPSPERAGRPGAGGKVRPDNESFNAFLKRLESRGVKPGLERVRRLLELCGSPHRSLSFVHVAGTNGKGSVCALVESILRAAGFRTGLFTSPHLVSYRERIRIGGRKIGERDLLAAAARLIPLAEGMKEEPCGEPSYFEFTTALAFSCLEAAGVDYAVIETGLGGRWDATNVVSAPVAAVTGIGLEHCAQLGDDLCSIAAEKAAIISEGARVVCGEMAEEAFRAVLSRCREKRATCRRVGDDILLEIVSQSWGGSEIVVRGALDDDVRLSLPLAGRHQASNCAVACAIAGFLHERGAPIPVEAIREGVAACRWPGRLQVVRRAPLILADCAHNPQGAAAAAAFLRDIHPGERWAVVIGVLRDKDIGGICGPLAPLAVSVTAVPVPSDRSAAPEAIAGEFVRLGVETVVTDRGVGEAVDRLTAEGAERIFVTGSIYLIGDLMRRLGIEPG